MQRAFRMVALSGLVALGPQGASAEDVFLLIRHVPSSGLVVADVDLTAAARMNRWEQVVPAGLQLATGSGRELPHQFAPAPDFDGRRRVAGTFVLRLPADSNGEVELRLREGPRPSPGSWDGTVRTKAFVVTHDRRRMGGLPSRMEFLATGKVLESFHWNDRLYHRERGAFYPRLDPQPELELLSRGPLCTVVRVRARYLGDNGREPPSRPRAIYDWYYFHDAPLVLVRAAVRQAESLAWHEHHFLELNFPGEEFPRWAGGDPMRQGRFEGTKKGIGLSRWGALLDKTDGIAILEGGQVLFHDGRGGYGTYLHAHSDAAWRPWKEKERAFSAWLWIGAAENPLEEVSAASMKLPGVQRGRVSVSRVRARLKGARKKATEMTGRRRHEARFQLALAGQLEGEGRFDEALRVLEGKPLEGWTALEAGDLRIALERTSRGVRLRSLFDATAGWEWLTERPLPLFDLKLRDVRTKEEARLTAESTWKEVRVEKTETGLDIRWLEPARTEWEGISVHAHAAPDRGASALHWTLHVENENDRWSLRRLVFPQVAAVEPDEQSCVLFPRGPGEVQRGVSRRQFRYQGLYPGGWTAMQFLAAYSEEKGRGLYVATHDPLASSKDISVESRPSDRAVVLAFDHPLPDMGKARNSFRLPGSASWRLFQGDWFDASVIYREWVRREASWFPPLGPDGRPDTPAWARELCVWALGGGAPQSCVPAVKEFVHFLGVPAGFHWYNWHQIPFDNDYPHYFPTKDGFKKGVAALQAEKVYVMPYINGRLWDTRDQQAEDFEFSRVARPAATKDEEGRPYTESYGSKEKDGTPVRLAPMCPKTQLWQDRVRGIVLRLFTEYGLDAVYIDQVAAASPRLCFDAAHGHPLGGGHWWVEGYEELLEAIRSAKAAQRMLTSECNAEPYVRWLDGYLTWHWQHDGQVPAFPAVYGGAIQMFGRAYRGGATKDLALRMKAGQQLVYGEQIGWIGPGVVKEKENADFLRQVVRLRFELRRYFHAGEMRRPPRLRGNIPKVRADWQWSGEWWVTTDAVLTGAWRLPRDKRLVLIFANVSDEAVSAALRLDGNEYGVTGDDATVTKITPIGPAETFTASRVFERTITFPRRQVWAWEVK